MLTHLALSGGISDPPASLHPHSEAVAVALGVEPVGAGARVGVLHEVAGATADGGLTDDLPVTERLDLRTDVADGGSEVANAESAACLGGGKTLAAGEVVDDTTLLGESVVHKNDAPMLDADLKEIES